MSLKTNFHKGHFTGQGNSRKHRWALAERSRVDQFSSAHAWWSDFWTVPHWKVWSGLEGCWSPEHCKLLVLANLLTPNCRLPQRGFVLGDPIPAP